jgi:hypothetical protein
MLPAPLNSPTTGPSRKLECSDVEHSKQVRAKAIGPKSQLFSGDVLSHFAVVCFLSTYFSCVLDRWKMKRFSPANFAAPSAAPRDATRRTEEESCAACALLYAWPHSDAPSSGPWRIQLRSFGFAASTQEHFLERLTVTKPEVRLGNRRIRIRW